MPIVYVHGVAVRDQQGNQTGPDANPLLDHLLEDVAWESIEPQLRKFVAPELSAAPNEVLLLRAYWGDLGGKLAWGGASFHHPEPARSSIVESLAEVRSHIMSDIRLPLNQMVARFFGDVLCYLNNRQSGNSPGPIPQRVIDELITAQKVKEQTGEPIVVLTNSMGGQIMYDVITYFLPRMAAQADIRIDLWCSVASQIGLFEELGLFLTSSPEYSAETGKRVPFPDRHHLGAWINVWDVDDVISYTVGGIIEDAEDIPFHVGRPLLNEHLGYLQDERFYKLFAEHVRRAIKPKTQSPKADG